MAEHIYRLIAIGTAWFVGLSFVRLSAARAALHAALTGLLCAAVAFWMTQRGTEPVWLLCVGAGLFLVSALAVRLWGRGWGAAIHCLLLSQSAYAILALPLQAFEHTGLPVLGIGLAGILLMLSLTCWLREKFPEEDWRSSYKNADEGRIPLRWEQMYLIPAILCLGLTASAVRFPVRTVSDCVWAGLLGSTAFWFGVWLMILMPAYKKERSAVLAEQQYRGEMQSFLNVIRSQRHDYNFHVQTIAGLIRQGKIDDCLRYVNALEEDSAIMNAVLPVKDPAISAMIHNFQILAVREGVRLHIDIRYDLSQIATNVYETNKIISNLLQNAIDETARHEDKSYGIWLNILKRGEYCVIRVSNKVEQLPTAEQLGLIYQQGYTTKQGHDGVGLSSLRTLIGRYRGALYTQMEGDVIHFVAKVPINYAKVPEE